MKKLNYLEIILSIALLTVYHLSNSQIYAQVSSPTPSLPPLIDTSSSENTNVDPSDINKIRQAVQQKVQEKLQAITQTKNTKKAWIGTITDTTVDSISLKHNDDTRTVYFTPDTAVINEKRVKITPDDLKKGQAILAMGELKVDNTLDAKRIVVTGADVLSKKQIIIGKIADISQSSSIFVLIPINNKSIQYQVKTDTNSQVVTKNNTKIDIKVLSAGQKIIAILSHDPKNPKSYSAVKIIAVDTLSSSSPTPTPKSSQ